MVQELKHYPLWYRCVCDTLRFILPRLFEDMKENEKRVFYEGYAYGCIDTKRNYNLDTETFRDKK